MEPPPAPAPPESEAHKSWLNRIRKKAARIRKRRAQHIQACRRHRISKATLVDTLFKALDTRSTGAWGRDELTNFALLTGFQGELDDLFVEVSHMLEDFGSSSTSSGSKALRSQDLASIVSRTGVLPLSKAELRRTIRFSEAPEMQGPLVCSGLRSRQLAQQRTDDHLRHCSAVEGGSVLAPHVLSLGAHPTSSVHRFRLRPQDPRASLPTGRRDVGRPLNRRGSHTDPHSPSSLAPLRSLPLPFFSLSPPVSQPVSGRTFGPRFSGSSALHPAPHSKR